MPLIVIAYLYSILYNMSEYVLPIMFIVLVLSTMAFAVLYYEMREYERGNTGDENYEIEVAKGRAVVDKFSKILRMWWIIFVFLRVITPTAENLYVLAAAYFADKIELVDVFKNIVESIAK